MVFFLALVLGLLLGWILSGFLFNRADDKSASAPLTPVPAQTGTPEATWSDSDAETAAPTDEPTAAPTDEPTAQPTPEATVEPSATAALSGFADGESALPTVAPTAQATAETTAEPTAEPTQEPTAEPTALPTPEPTVAPEKGTKENPVLIGEPYAFVAQVHADGTPKMSETDVEQTFDLPITLTLSRYMTPEYYSQTYAEKYKLKGDEAGAQLDVSLGTVEGLDSVEMQNAILIMFENGAGEINAGYKFTDMEIGGESKSELKTASSGTIYKRFKFDAMADPAYMTLTYYANAKQVVVYFSLTESVLPEETPAPTETPAASETPVVSASAAAGSYTIGDVGDGVKQLQDKLIALGYLAGPSDGKFGNWTADAVKAAQGDFGLEKTGIADAQFLEILSKK